MRLSVLIALGLLLAGGVGALVVIRRVGEAARGYIPQ